MNKELSNCISDDKTTYNNNDFGLESFYVGHPIKNETFSLAH